MIEPCRPNNVGELLEWLKEHKIHQGTPLFNYDCAPSPDIEFEFVESQGITVTILGEDEYVYDQVDDEEDEE